MTNLSAAHSDLVSQLRQAASADKLTETAVRNVEQWLGSGEYAAYHEQILALIRGERYEELDRLFWQVIPFGTGGRRGPMAELGSATINPRTIAESAHGLAVYLQQSRSEPAGSAVVAHDTRNNSPKFARITATTLAANGLKVFYFEDFRSTPELSFAVRHLGCDIGAMISASHNPPGDNGFKAYWSNGGQVLPPHDQGIIDCVYEAQGIPQVGFEDAVAEGRIEVIGEEVDRAYWDAVVAQSLSDHRDITALYSPLHGVGELACYRVLQQAGFDGIAIFEPHREPDGNFPNVPDHLPNPERADVFHPLIEQADRDGINLLLASDPDADRIGVCVRRKAGDSFVHLTGNQIGALLADYVLRQRAAANSLSANYYLVETLVTTPLIGKIAGKHGVQIVDDLLVGFKYIGQTIDQKGPEHFVFGCEESLGYLAGTHARDKDAGVAALLLAECAAELAADQKSLLDRLDELYVEHGYFEETQVSRVCEGPTGSRQIEHIMTAFRERPPERIGDVNFQQCRDYREHEIRAIPAGTRIQKLPEPSGNLLFFESRDEDRELRIAVRPSGTEPKIKFYVFARQGFAAADALATARDQTAERIRSFTAALNEWIDRELDLFSAAE